MTADDEQPDNQALVVAYGLIPVTLGVVGDSLVNALEHSVHRGHEVDDLWRWGGAYVIAGALSGAFMVQRRAPLGSVASAAVCSAVICLIAQAMTLALVPGSLS